MSVSFVNKRQSEPWTIIYGIARSLLAMATALTLITNRTDVLFPSGMNFLPKSLSAAFITQLNLFTIVPHESLGLVKWVAIAVLLLVASGWYPRFTAIPHWWISWSFAGACSFPDGGDHVTTVMTCLMLPVALTDPRQWQWTACSPMLGVRHPRWHELRRFLARSGLVVVRLQVAVIYAHAATAKLGVTEWTNGTALYYWLNHPVFGPPYWLRTITDPLTASAVGVVFLTWSAIAIESVLFTGLFMVRSWRLYLFVLGLGFHAMIVVFHGLPSFSLAMTGALTVYLLTPEGLATLQRLPRQFWSRRFFNIPPSKGESHVDSSEASGTVSAYSTSNRNDSPLRQLRPSGWSRFAKERLVRR
jgi:antimicrobial peptide system SdpB family protein